MNTAAASTRTMLLGAMCLLPACSVGPDYVRPDSPAPAAFKELQGWQPAQPQDQLGRGPWWKMFGDPLLDELEQQVEISNLNVAIASAQFRAAKALVQQTRAGRLPTVTADASVDRSRGPVGTGNRVIGSANQATSYSAALDASWELDVWGRVRRSVEANEAGAQASAADLESARLSAQATLAGDFWLLRAVDAQKQLLDDTVTAYQRSLQMVTNRNVQGVASKGEVVQAQTQLESVRAQALDLGVQRAQLEHAIAVLIGKPPAELTIVPAPLGTKVPQVPVGLPSQLLERRPDVAAAERRVAAASARIGVAAAAFYPALTLSGSAGYRSTDLTHWITAPARFWSFGPALAETLFDGGARAAVSAGAQAALDAEVATYRETVLSAFAEVEDQCAALRILEQEALVQAQAVTAARQSVTIAENQYKAGTISYVDVVTVQTVALANERTAVGILGRQLAASVLLVKALGGGWQASSLPNAGEL